MKTIGIVGGLSPESTIAYYRRIVRKHLAERGDHAYPRVVIAGVSFQQYVDWQHAGDWDSPAAALQKEFEALHSAGADFAVLATNTMHKVLPAIRSPIPILSVFEAVAAGCTRLGISRLVLTGTRFTMADGFYQQGLAKRGISTVVPPPAQQGEIHRIIFEELVRGVVTPGSVGRYAEICRPLLDSADAVLLGCTELQMLAETSAFDLPFVDTTAEHADLAWSKAL